MEGVSHHVTASLFGPHGDRELPSSEVQGENDGQTSCPEKRIQHDQLQLNVHTHVVSLRME